MAELKRDSTPLGDKFSLETVIQGLSEDLAALRSGKISVDDARVRAELAKQVFNGVRLVVSAQKYLSQQARLVSGVDNPSSLTGE